MTETALATLQWFKCHLNLTIQKFAFQSVPHFNHFRKTLNITQNYCFPSARCYYPNFLKYGTEHHLQPLACCIICRIMVTLIIQSFTTASS